VIPGEFRYWEHLDKPRVRRIRRAWKALFGFDPAPPDDVVRDFAAMYYDADPLCEAFVDEAGKNYRALLERALAEGVGDWAPASLRALFADLDRDPAWVDWELVDRGARAFRRYGTAMFRFAGSITLEGYSESSVAKPLALTGAYAGGSTRHRFLETCAFWIAVSEPGGLVRGGAGRGSALRVRVMHVFVRRKIEAQPAWNRDAWGVPINQGDALLTLMGGSFIPGVMLGLLGFIPSRGDILAMMHFWRYVGHLMGVRPRWYPSTLREAAQLAFVTIVKAANQSGDDGTLLRQAYVRAFADAGWLEDGLHRGYARLFVSPQTYRKAALPAAGAWPLVVLAQAPLVAAAEVVRRVSPRADALLDRLARARRKRWFERHMNGRSAEYKPAQNLQDDGRAK